MLHCEGHLVFPVSPCGPAVTAVVVEDDMRGARAAYTDESPDWRWTPKLGSIFWFCPSSPLSSQWSPLSCRRVLSPGKRSWRRGSPPAHHLLAPLAAAGLLQAPAGRLDGQGTRGHGGQEAAAAVHGESQGDGGLQHHLQEENSQAALWGPR